MDKSVQIAVRWRDAAPNETTEVCKLQPLSENVSATQFLKIFGL